MYRNTYLSINLDNLCDNITNITKTYHDYDYYIGVIKGNAYGHGEYISQYLIDSGINYLAVSSLEEALNVRKYINMNTPILVLEPIPLKYINIAIENNLTLCISSLEYYNNLLNVNITNQIKFHLKINTGMNRLGVSNKKDIKYIYDHSINNDKLYMEGIFSHLQTSGVFDNLNKKQVDKFQDLVSEIDLSKIKIIHLERSCTLDFFPKLSFCNAVRVGIMMYGINSSFPQYSGIKGKLKKIKLDYFRRQYNLPIPYTKPNIIVKQSLSLISEVIELQKVSAGEYVGYGANHKIKKDGYIAVIPVGYADGLPTQYSNFSVTINNKLYDVIGSINMCMITVFVDDTVHQGDIVKVIDENIDYKKTANSLNISPYTLMTNMSYTLPRVYTKNGKQVKIINK